MGNHQVWGIYLAAGQSRRMGQNKLALLWHGKPLGIYGLQAAVQSQLDHVVVVLNKNADNKWVNTLKSHRKIRLLDCPWANEGQAASICCGIEEAIKSNVDSVMILLADMPFIRPNVIDRLIDRKALANKEQQPYDYVSYKIDSVLYPPVLFNKSMFPLLLDLKGDIGARQLLKGHNVKGIHLDWPNVITFADVDTIEDFRNLPD